MSLSTAALATGVDFVARITAEVKVVQDDIVCLQRLAADLHSSIQSESKIRDGLITKVNDRISQERKAETQLRTSLEAKLEEFEAKTKSWVGALGKDGVATKDQLTVLEGTVKEHAQRFKEVEQMMPAKAPLQQLLKLEADLSLLKSDVQRDFANTAQSIRSTAATAAHEYRMCQDGLVRVQMYAEALEPRVYEELKTKASASTVNSISGRLSGLNLDLEAHQARTLADKETVLKQIGTVEQAVHKQSRQQDADRDRASTALLAVEREMSRELSTKALKVETDLIGPNILRAAHDAIEGRALRLEQNVMAVRQEQVPYKNRLEALEMAFPTKADAAEIPRLTLAISDSNARHDATFKRAQEQGMKLDKIDSHINHHVVKLEGLENRGNLLEGKVNTKAELTDHFTKDNVVELLKEFYRKDEVDTMMSRIWWRVGDVTKGRITHGPDTSSPRSVMLR